MASKSKTGIFFATLLASSPLSDGGAAHDAGRSAILSVCEVDTPDHAYAGRRVTIEAPVATDMHSTGLIDQGCHPYGLPFDELHIKVPTNYSADSGIDRFAYFVLGPGAAEEQVVKSMKCICSGTIEYSSGLVVLNLEKAEMMTMSKDGRHYVRIH
jgi:hypothetical protein